MQLLRFGLWRVFFVLSAVFLLTGGPQHPRGSMAEMLAHPKWVASHTLMLAGFLAFLAGLILFQRSVVLPDRTRRWVRFAAIGTALQAVEMAVHTAAVVDHAHLVAGMSTPVLTTHLWLSVILYPVFGLTVVGLIIASTRDRSLGSPWISWLGILGALGHGAAAPLTILAAIPWAPLLFPMMILLALWMLLAAFWPLRRIARGTQEDGLAIERTELESVELPSAVRQ